MVYNSRFVECNSLSDLHLDNIHQWPKLAKCILMVFLVFLISFLAYEILLKNDSNSMNRLSNNLNRLNTKFSEMQGMKSSSKSGFVFSAFQDFTSFKDQLHKLTFQNHLHMKNYEWDPSHHILKVEVNGDYDELTHFLSGFFDAKCFYYLDSLTIRRLQGSGVLLVLTVRNRP